MHREEKPYAIKRDQTDRELVRAVLKNLINPLNVKQITHHKELVNIFTGQIADEACNLDEAVQIGTNQSTAFLNSLPDGIYSTIKQEIKESRQ